VHGPIDKKSFLARDSICHGLGFPSRFCVANYKFIILLVVFTVPFMTRGARYALETNQNDVRDWLPAGDQASQELAWFQEHFAGEQFAVVSWDGCTLGDTQKLQLLAAKLKLKTEPAAGQRPLIKSVLTGPQLVDQLTSPPLQLPYEEALYRLEGSFVGPAPEDGEDRERTTCMLVTLSKYGQSTNDNKRAAIDMIKSLAIQECAVAPDALHMGGPPVDNVAIDEEGQRTLVRLVGLSGVVGLFLSYLCFRSFKLTIMVFAVGVLSAALSLAVVFYFGIFEIYGLGRAAARLGTVDAILMSMPSVVYVLGLSGAIHIVNYYRDARRETGTAGAAETAVSHGWLPCTLAAVTTAVGLGSLYISDITPIKKFGVFSAIGVVGTLALLFTLLPVSLHRFPPSNDPRRNRRSRLAGLGRHVADRIIKHNILVASACIVALIFFAAGLTRIETRIQLLKLFDADARIIQDYRWLETHLGNLVPMEVVLSVEPERFRSGDEPAVDDSGIYRLNLLDRMRLAKRVQRRIEALPHVGRSLSPATFGPDLSGERSLGARVIGLDPDYVLNEKLEKHREQIVDAGYLRYEPVVEDALPTSAPGAGRRELLRISARLEALSDVDYGAFVARLRQEVKPVLSSYQQRDKVLTALLQQDKQLRLSRICLLYHSPGSESSHQRADRNAAQPAAPGPATPNEAASGESVVPSELLGELLREAGARVRGINVEQFADRGTEARLSEQLGEFFAGQDCIIVDSSAADAADAFADTLDAAPLVVRLPENPGSPEEIAATYTGIVPLVYQTQAKLLVSLIESTGTAFGLIAIVMIFVLRSVPAGTISMLPNAFPIVLVFGTMGWLGVKVDIGIMMTASVALGVAVDDTVHYLSWFRHGTQLGLGRQAATRLAYQRCAGAMFQTTVIGGIGLSMFAFSTFTPTQQFGILMVTLLSAALLGDLVFLPALLSGPIGYFFGKRDEPGTTDATGWDEVAEAAAPDSPADKRPESEEPAVPDDGNTENQDESVFPQPMHHRRIRQDAPHRSITG